MKFFIESVNRQYLEELQEVGLVDGVVVDKWNGDSLGGVIKEETPVCIRLRRANVTTLVRQARALATQPNRIILFSLTRASLKAIYQLRGEEIITAVTSIKTVAQGLMAIRAGADYLSLCLGKTAGIAKPHVTFLWELRQLADHRVDIMVPIRYVSQLEDVCLGADIGIISEEVIPQLWTN